MEFQAEFILIGDRLQIRYYGIIIVFAMLVAAWVATRLAKRDGKDPDHVWGALTWAIIPAIIGARLWYVIFPPLSLTADGVVMDTAWFFANFFNLENGAVAIWTGGLSIFGAVIGGGLGAYIYLRRNKLPVWAWLDIAGICLPLGQAIGRWANFINQELYGIPTTLPWGIPIDLQHRIGEYRSTVQYPIMGGDGQTETLFHPLFLYESLWNLLTFVVLLSLFQRRRKQFAPGSFFLLYVMSYSFMRFLLEFIRVQVSLVSGINVAQVVCVVAFVIALVVFLARQRQVAAPTTATSKAV
ncbi:MAG: prolipoprotein diacylglyceryl transferase [Chloroflexota bacterium]|nr:prolipoprotein diacylglyceryl transferase [Chloroflexota bacterium]